MPIRFSKVSEVLYRGGAPKPWEISVLKNDFGIEQIISLDKESSDKIDDACAENKIAHIIIPINSSSDIDSDLNFIKSSVNRLIGNKVTYVHCKHGKDRTGLFVAKYRTENGWTCKRAIDEALSFGFGSGLSQEVIRKYVSLIDYSCGFRHNHISPEQVMARIYKVSSSSEAIRKIASILDYNVTETDNDEDKGKTAQELADQDPWNSVDDKGIGGGNTVSDLFHVAKDKRKNIIKNMLLKSAEQKISFEIPEYEKRIANALIKLLKTFVEEILFKSKVDDNYQDILDILYNPFKEHVGVTAEQAEESKQFFEFFCDILDNSLIQVKKVMVKVLELFETFNTGAETITSALFDSVDKLSKEVLNFKDVLNDTKNKNFQDDAIKGLEILKKSIAQLKQLINERIISYLRKNILNEDWTTEIKKDLSSDLQKQKED